MQRYSAKLLASVLAKTCDQDTIAGIIGATVGANDDERLTRAQASAACELFDTLCKLCPDAMTQAQEA